MLSSAKIKIALSVVVAIILLQTLFFKFTAAPESVAIFTQLRAEPLGRIASGIIELIAAIAIVVPKTRLWGAILAILVMFGALTAHAFVLGFAGPHASLSVLAIITLVSAAGVVYLQIK